MRSFGTAGACAAIFATAAMITTVLPGVAGGAPVSTQTCIPEINDNYLSLDPAVIDGWYDVSTGTPGTKINSIEDWRTVPGATLEFRASVTIRAHGSPVSGTLRIDGAGLTGDPELRSRMTLTQELGMSGTKVTHTDNGREIPVRATLAFDASTPNLLAQSQSVDLSAVEIVLTGDTSDTGIDCPGSGGGGGGGGGGNGGGGDQGGYESGELPGRDVGNRVPISQVPSGPISR